MESGEGKIVGGDCEKLDEAAVQDISARFVSRLSAMCCAADQDAGMEKSMELDLGDSIVIHDVREVRDDGDGDAPHHRIPNLANSSSPCGEEEEEGDDALMSRFPEKVFLSTVFEGEEGEEELESGYPEEEEEEEEVEKEVIEENSDRYGGGSSSARDLNFDAREDMDGTGGDASVFARRTRIQNIFRLCGNHRDLAQAKPELLCPAAGAGRRYSQQHQKMKIIAAYLLAVLGGNANPSAGNLKDILASVGAEADDDRIEFLLSAVGVVVSAAGTGGAAAEANKEGKVEEKEESDEDMDFSLFD